jgi:hypothetical protein
MFIDAALSKAYSTSSSFIKIQVTPVESHCQLLASYPACIDDNIKVLCVIINKTQTSPAAGSFHILLRYVWQAL